MNQPKLPSETLDTLQRQTFDYFVYEVNPLNGLVVDKTQEGASASIAAVGLALSAYPVGVERGFVTRAEAVERTLATLRFFRNSSQGKGAEATGYNLHSAIGLKPFSGHYSCTSPVTPTAG
jgi:hypothetical protein